MKYKSIILYVVLFTTIATACRKGNSGGNLAPPPPEKKVFVSTFAGDGTDAYLDGPLLSAKFHTPVDIAISASGILYVADYNGRRIRKITGGQVSLLAGDGNFGTRNGAGDTAQDVSVALFRQGMGGIAMGAQGAVYIDDTNNGRIRKISADGQVSTFAGKETTGFVDGDTSVAEFLNPNGILFDKQGNMYVADNGNYCIRKITPAGMVSRFTGMGTNGMADGPAGTAQFHYICDMVIDKDGNLLLCDGYRIRKVNPAGEVSTIAGSTTGYADGDGPTAQFNYPAGLAIDAEGSLYVADAMNNRVRKISFK